MHILFTRPLDDSLTMIKKFKDLGHDVSHMPLLRIEKIENNNFDNFSKIFTCKSENDILAEIFFLISNLYSSQEDYEMSNFYLNISNYLNPKFKFNLSLASENFYLMNKDLDLKKSIEWMCRVYHDYQSSKKERATQLMG